MQFKVLNTYLDLFGELMGGGDIVPAPSTGSPATDGVYVTLDQWDGFQAERQQFVNLIASQRLKNFVAITGDIHTFIAGYIKKNFDDATDPPQSPPETNLSPPDDAVGVEFVCGSVTSSNLTEIATFGRGRASIPGQPDSAERRDFTEVFQTSNNRHFKYFNSDTHGYNLMEVTKAKLTCTMKYVDTVKAPNSASGTLKVFEVPEGQFPPRIIDVTP
jgi:alkaline phosphatase D